MERLVVDHVQMPKAMVNLTGQEVMYALTMVDQATNWPEIIPLPDCGAKTTALAIQTHWLARYGMPKSIHSDLGSAYTSQLFQELCKLNNIDHTCASSQNHKSVSRSEGTHRLLLSGLRKLCLEHSDWPNYLPHLLLGLRSSAVTTVELSPAYMLFHRELRLPITATIP